MELNERSASVTPLFLSCQADCNGLDQQQKAVGANIVQHQSKVGRTDTKKNLKTVHLPPLILFGLFPTTPPPLMAGECLLAFLLFGN